ncbi:MAG: 2,4'-dihydroxyacetophenone dioxygenase family protein [Acidimicrobiales bacterium]
MSNAPVPMVPMHGITEARHLGADEVPWVFAGDLGIKLLHVDLNQGLWVLVNRFPPGYKVQTHYHTGAVFAYTIAGAWGYVEYPHYENRAGSYLFEPAHSVHTLTVPATNDEITEVWFAIYGANVNIDGDGQVIAVTDAQSVLGTYRALCEAAGEDHSKVIVVGEPI